MNNNQENITSSQPRVRLPKPDKNNITVLTHNLPNTPILPWNRFDSPHLHRSAAKPEPQHPDKRGKTFLTILTSIQLILGLIALFILLFNHDLVMPYSYKIVLSAAIGLRVIISAFQQIMQSNSKTTE